MTTNNKILKFLMTRRAFLSAALIFCLAFVASFVVASSLTSAELTNADTLFIKLSDTGYTASVSSADTININLNTTPAGTTTTAKDVVNIKTNAPSGYKLYISSNQSTDYDSTHPGNALYQDGNSTSSYFISPTTGTISSPANLANNQNSWGISKTGELGDFFPVPLKSNPTKISENDSATSDSGDNLDVYYGINANAALPSGTYIGTVNYTVAPETSVSVTDVAGLYPNKVDVAGGDVITIVISLYTNYEFATSDISVTVGGSSCAVRSASTSEGNLVLTCVAPAKSAGNYDVSISVPKFNKSYTTTLTYFTIPEFFQITRMDQMTSDICYTATTPLATASESDTTGSHSGDTAYVPETVLVDVRDGNSYRIRKLADGNCWMTENLQLNLSSSVALTSENTDLNSKASWTPANSTLTTLPGWEEDSGKVQSFDGERSNYYSWAAATAGSGTAEMVSIDATDSICPKGWSLPSSNDWAALDLAAGGTGVNRTDQAGVARMNSFPYEIQFSGSINASSAAEPSLNSVVGSIISRTAYTSSDNINAMAIYRSSSSTHPNAIYPRANGPKYTGRPIRCVAKKQTLFDITTMQQMTPAVCANTTTPLPTAKELYDEDGSHAGDTSYVPQRTLYDVRDGNTYRVRKLADGNCWMTENLDLALTEGLKLNSSNTDIAGEWVVAADEATISEPDGPWGTGSDYNDTAQITDTELNTVHSYNGNGSAGDRTIATSKGNATPATDGSDQVTPIETQNIGTYYNWYAATVKSGTADLTSGNALYSICPKGWKLPDNDGNKSFKNLLFATYGLSDNNAASNGKARSYPLSFVYSGAYHWVIGTVENQGVRGVWWSSTALSRTHAYNLAIHYGPRLIPQRNNIRAYGFSVRCVSQ